MKANYTYYDRELSWLSFNARVLQEARDPSVPLFERITFLAIYSSNLDEFFRVRVASLRSLLSLKKKSIRKLDFDPAALLNTIHTTVAAQQEEFGAIFRDEILPALRREGIVLLREGEATEQQRTFLHTYFRNEVRPHLNPLHVRENDDAPFLKNKALYLVAELAPEDSQLGLVPSEHTLGLVDVPASLPRFVWVPGLDSGQYVMFLDDVIRLNAGDLFPGYRVGQTFEVKLTRDADLYLEDEFRGGLIDRIKKGLARREKGVPCRFLYDHLTPHETVAFLQQRLGLTEEDMVPGARYHNFSDFLHFPRFGRDGLAYAPLPPLPLPDLEQADTLLAAISQKDRLISFPYHKFDYVLRFLREAARDPDVEEVWITLYRVAENSAVAEALIEAARNGKRVTAFVELRARFDEKSNVEWSERMKEFGVTVHYDLPGLKVHAKLALVVRREHAHERLYAYLATGNFNEDTARIYADYGLFTADPRLTQEVRRVFAYVTGENGEPEFEHLLVAPLNLRKQFYRLIKREARNVREGGVGYAVLKMNSIEDERIIARLYDASKAGVNVRMLVRGICCLVPGVDGQSENVYVTSIVDRFLEHARVYFFHNEGREDVYLASADWMRRNLNRRVEVAFPIYDPDVKRRLLDVLTLQVNDNCKARIIDPAQRNDYVRNDEPPVRAQLDTYRCLEQMLNQPASAAP